MSRHAKPPRLYLDPRRRIWGIRYLNLYKRTGFPEAKKDRAEAILNKLLRTNNFLKAFNEFGSIQEIREQKREPLSRFNWIGTIYFVSKRGCTEYPIKIGFSGPRFKRRLSDIQTGNPHPLEIIAQQKDLTYGLEQKLHSILAPHRVLGEWFSRSEMVMEASVAAKENRLPEWIETTSLSIAA